MCYNVVKFFNLAYIILASANIVKRNIFVFARFGILQQIIAMAFVEKQQMPPRRAARRKIMWIYDSPIGKIEIKFDRNVKKYALWLGDECGGFYPTPEAAADDVYTQSSGIDTIDSLKGSKSNILPDGLGKWDKIPD